jgi:hypothetical protein
VLQRQNQIIELSFQEIRSKATPEQRMYVFEILSLLQYSIQSNCVNLKRDHASQGDIDTTSVVSVIYTLPRRIFI